jgi:hypothetical protein
LWAFVLSLQHYHPFNLEALTLSLCGEWEWRIWIWIWFLVFDFILLVILYLLLFAPQMEKRRPSIFLISTPHDKIELHFVFTYFVILYSFRTELRFNLWMFAIETNKY